MKNYNNILIGGYDFEQKIHRGITFYGKALVKSLYDLNKNTSLLTSAKYKEEPQLQLLRILRQLEDPDCLGKKEKIINYLKYILTNYKVSNVENLYKNSNIHNKLNYLKYVNSFYNIPHIYDLTTVYNRLNVKKAMSITLENSDIFFTTSPTNIKVNTALIQTLHDVIPLKSIYHPPQDDSKIFYYRVKNMLEYSQKVISVSEYSKNECLKIFPEYQDKIIVTHQPIPIYEDEEELSNDTLIQESILKNFKLKSSNYLFYVGMLEKRKNIKSLIEAFLAIYDKIKIPLVLAGGLGYGKEEFEHYLRDKKYKKKIKYLGYINNIEKLVLLKNSNAFLFPTLEEGFGLPPLEAMKMGTVVLTSNTSSLPEVCGDAALYINPYNLKELAEGIVEIVENSALRDKLLISSKEQVKEFTYNKFRDNITKVLEDL